MEWKSRTGRLLLLQESMGSFRGDSFKRFIGVIYRALCVWF